jgi:hypothetical protein
VGRWLLAAVGVDRAVDTGSEGPILQCNNSPTVAPNERMILFSHPLFNLVVRERERDCHDLGMRPARGMEERSSETAADTPRGSSEPLDAKSRHAAAMTSAGRRQPSRDRWTRRRLCSEDMQGAGGAARRRGCRAQVAGRAGRGAGAIPSKLKGPDPVCHVCCAVLLCEPG